MRNPAQLIQGLEHNRTDGSLGAIPDLDTNSTAAFDTNSKNCLRAAFGDSGECNHDRVIDMTLSSDQGRKTAHRRNHRGTGTTGPAERSRESSGVDRCDRCSAAVDTPTPPSSGTFGIGTGERPLEAVRQELLEGVPALKVALRRPALSHTGAEHRRVFS